MVPLEKFINIIFLKFFFQHLSYKATNLKQELDSRGCIEKGVYRGWYSVADEAYVPTDQVEEVTDEDGSKNIVSHFWNFSL